MPHVRPPRRSHAFTLIELLTVIAIVAILIAISLGAISGVKERASLVRARSELAALAAALEDYKRLYGDYPQLGDFTQAPATPAGTAGPGIMTTQAKLFNCLTGVLGPRGLDRLNGPVFLDVGKFTVHGTLTATTFLVPSIPSRGAPPAKTEQNVGLVDPWGRYYIYYYKSGRNPGSWQASSYVLYSAGRLVAANGSQTPSVTPTTGLLLGTQTAEMTDNIYANP